MQYLLVLFVTLLIPLTTHNYAEAQTTDNANTPLEISADGALEWHRTEQKFIATKNARAAQGDTTIAAQKLTAIYADNSGKKFDIQNITAQTDVTITSQNATVYGDNATYNVASGNAEVTGNTLRLQTDKETLRANDRFIYDINAGKLSALGNARLEQINAKGEKTTLSAARIDAILTDNQNGKRTLKTLEAKNNVTITTPTETITGEYGIYNAANKTAQLTGGVIIKRGANILQGARADVDLRTNISRILGASSSNTSSNTRVRGVFYPNSTP